jgi:hypothetical protein
MSENQKCSYKGFKRDCGMFYPKTGMCSLLVQTGSELEQELDNFKAHKDCEVYKSTLERLGSEKNKAEQIAALEVAEQTNLTKEFDYSAVDEETGAFLQEKANRITEIRIKSVVAIGKELKEAQDRLASHNKYEGSFQKWVESIGITPRTAYNYINGFDYVVKNFHNIEDAENIQPSLLFAASKPSAPKELSDKVATGDITTHKQYKELEAKLKDAELHYKTVSESYDHLEKTNTRHHQRLTQLEIQNKSLLRDFEAGQTKLQKLQDEKNSAINELNETKQRLEWARKGGNPEKIKELEQEINGLQQQLHDKPIEVAATEVVEKEIIPDEVAEAIYCKIKYLYESIKNLTDKEIQIFAAHVDPAYYDTLTSDIDEAIVILEKISAAAYGATNMIEPEGHCGDCVNADMDAVTEEQLDEGKTLCTVTAQVVDIMDGCGKYKFFGAQS